MPSNYYRTEIHFPSDLDHKLEVLRNDMSREAGKRVRKNAVVVEIVRMFFEKDGLVKKENEELLRSQFEVVKQEAKSGGNSAPRSTRK